MCVRPADRGHRHRRWSAAKTASEIATDQHVATAAQALGAGCVRVNPYDTRELARGFHLALSMSAEQRGVLHAHAEALIPSSG